MNRMSLIILGTATTFFCGPALAQCGGEGAGTPSRQVARQEQDIVTAATQAGSFSTLLTALKEAGLADTLKGNGPFTVFAPTDEAFAKLPAGTLEALLKDKAKLQAILTYHVVSGTLDSKSVLAGAPLKTLQGQMLTAKASEGKVNIDQAQLLKADLECSNGVIHVIDTVLIPK